MYAHLQKQGGGQLLCRQRRLAWKAQVHPPAPRAPPPDLGLPLLRVLPSAPEESQADPYAFGLALPPPSGPSSKGSAPKPPLRLLPVAGAPSQCILGEVRIWGRGRPCARSSGPGRAQLSLPFPSSEGGSP